MKEHICQSCGMPMPAEDLFGTNADGSFNTDYCIYCYKQGKFTNAGTMDEQIEHCAQFVEDFNKSQKKPLTKEEAIANMKEEFPKLKRWMSIRQKAEWVLKQCKYVTLSSITEKGYPRPIAIEIIKTNGISTIWMSTGTSSEKVKHFHHDSKAGICFVHEGDSVTLTGHVIVLTDTQNKTSFWKDYFIHYYPQGVNDPEYCLLQFDAEEATIWIDKELVRCKI